jgi:hypothetical protein
MPYKVRSTTIMLPKTMPLPARISMAGAEFHLWMETLKRPFNNDETHMVRLAKCEQNGKGCVYYYETLKRAEDWHSTITVCCGFHCINHHILRLLFAEPCRYN